MVPGRRFHVFDRAAKRQIADSVCCSPVQPRSHVRQALAAPLRNTSHHLVHIMIDGRLLLPGPLFGKCMFHTRAVAPVLSTEARDDAPHAVDRVCYVILFLPSGPGRMV